MKNILLLIILAVLCLPFSSYIHHLEHQNESCCHSQTSKDKQENKDQQEDACSLCLLLEYDHLDEKIYPYSQHIAHIHYINELCENICTIYFSSKNSRSPPA